MNLIDIWTGLSHQPMILVLTWLFSAATIGSVITGIFLVAVFWNATEEERDWGGGILLLSIPTGFITAILVILRGCL